jgi:tetratricopeptide (TPR) repeat protein
VKQRIKTLLAGGLLTLALFGGATAGPLEEGDAAFLHGDYATVSRLADQGDAKAQTYLGFMYEYGQGVAQDYAQAVMWYRKAADQGYAPAQTGLGEIEGGHGVPQDYAQAAMRYRKAADQGDTEAQDTGAELYVQCSGYARFERYPEALAACTAALNQSFFVEPIVDLDGKTLSEGTKVEGSLDGEGLIRFQRAYIFMKLDRPREGITDFTRAIELGMKESAYFGRGLAWEKLGERERAREDFASVAKTQGGWSVARAKLLEYGLLTGPCKYWGALCW